jgi:hypothetical protein
VRKRFRSLTRILLVRSLVFMCMRRGPNLKLLPPVLRAADVVMMAIPFSREPRPLVLGPKGQAPLLRLEQGFFTGGYHAVYRGYHCYRWGMVTVPSGSNRWKNSNLNLNSKK